MTFVGEMDLNNLGEKLEKAKEGLLRSKTIYLFIYIKYKLILIITIKPSKKQPNQTTKGTTTITIEKNTKNYNIE